MFPLTRPCVLSVENTPGAPHLRAIPDTFANQIVSHNNEKTKEDRGMSIMFNKDPFITAQVVDLVMRERQIALSPREWQHRLAGYGYAIKDTADGQVIETLPHHVEVAMLPADIAA